jgi:multidrug efflux pump subunit AcrA (membrane-fusion protein)
MRIELTEVPERSAVLLIYPAQRSPIAEAQIEDLKQLGLYGDATRSVAEQVPIGGETAPAETDLTQPATSDSLQDRNSLRLFHLDLDLGATSYRIVNESRRLLGCDRVTLLVPKSGHYRVSAVSGVSVVDRRSNAIRATERLTQAAVVMSRPLILPSEEPLPPQIQEPLDDYLDESGVMSALLMPLYAADDQADAVEASELDPLTSAGQVIAVMVIEYFSGHIPMSIGPAMKSVAGEAALSLRNSMEHQQVFGLRLWKSVGRMLQSFRRPLVTGLLLLAVGLLLASMICQIEHYVIATGNVEPKVRRDVFATVDGIVKELQVQDGQRVKMGDPLLELENAELDSRAESLAGEIQTASKRLVSIQAVRLSLSADPSQSSRLALEERQLESELANLRAQQEIVRAQQKELLITSPIDGTVIAWQLHRRLNERPVARGNLLVSVADHNGPWSLRLKVPDRDSGPVLASVKSQPELPVRFAVATQPRASYAATLESIATAARLDELGEHVIDATALVSGDVHAEPDQDELDTFVAADMRVGADVTAKIACGNRSVLRSWFGDVFDFVHRNILFYF